MNERVLALISMNAHYNGTKIVTNIQVTKL